MVRLLGFVTQNTLKSPYALAGIGAEYEFRHVDLGRGENKIDDFEKMARFRVVPVLDHDGNDLLESGAIYRYVANVSDSPLYPAARIRLARQ